MAKREAKDTEEKERLRHLKKEVKPVYDRLKQNAESNDAKSRQDLAGMSPSEQGHLAKNPQVLGTQKTDAVLGLQQTQGNKYVQRLAEKSGQATLDKDIVKKIEARRGSGQPLDPEVRSEMETAFGHDFSDVRVHTDTEAANLSEQLQAKAFTINNDVFFKQDSYQSQSQKDRKLLAHELTHVMQQQNMNASYGLMVGPANDQFEKEADRAAQQSAEGTLIDVHQHCSSHIQRGEGEEEEGEASIRNEWVNQAIAVLESRGGEPERRARECLQLYSGGLSASDDDYLTSSQADMYYSLPGPYDSGILPGIATHYSDRVQHWLRYARDLDNFVENMILVDTEIYNGYWRINQLYQIHGDTSASARELRDFWSSRQSNSSHILNFYGGE